MRSTGIRSIEGCFNGLLLVGGVFVRENCAIECEGNNRNRNRNKENGIEMVLHVHSRKHTQVKISSMGAFKTALGNRVDTYETCH